MLHRTFRRLGSTNRYTDGSGRALESNVIPRDLYLETISNRAYPVVGEHWQPVVAGKPSPHKGNVIISGGGVVGLTIASQFALRGWHTTVVERRRPQTMAPTPAPSVTAELPCALLTRRAVDALETAGVRTNSIRDLGVPVVGVLDHPGAYNSLLTWGLTEHHAFAVKMLSMDLSALRGFMEGHVRALPNANLQIFHEHVIEAVYPLRQQLVVRPWSGSAAEKAAAAAAVDLGSVSADSSSDAARTAAVVSRARLHKAPKDTSLTLSTLKWEKNFAEDAVDYDLLISAEGVNSHLRDLLDVEGFISDVDFGVKWFLLRSPALSNAHVHRWLHTRSTTSVTTAASYHVRSPAQVPMCMAFPRTSASYEFSLMAYMPIGEMEHLSDAEFLKKYLADVVKADPAAQLFSHTSSSSGPGASVQPAPTVYCEQLHNSVGLPSAVVVGDAAHYSHPFWMQGLAMALEDGVNLLNQVDAYSRHFYDAVSQYSNERGACGDALRVMTDRCLYYERKKHHNPLVRMQNTYQRHMNLFLPKRVNTTYEGSVNHLYSLSIEEMLNGRGYTSYDYAEKQQAKHRMFYHLGRLYT